MRTTHAMGLCSLLIGAAPGLAGAEGDPAQGRFTLAEATAGLSGTGPLLATIQTSMGTFTCNLFDKEAPGTVANFVGLARGERAFLDPKSGRWVKRPFYDGLIFHRVIPGFMIQGGDPEGTGSGDPGYKISDEQNAPHRFDRGGMLAMANAGPNTAGCQFFITEKATQALDDGVHPPAHYQIFGQCNETALVKKIAAVPRNREDRPETEVKIVKVTIKRAKSG